MLLSISVALILGIAMPAPAQVLLWDSSGVAVCTADGWQRNPRLVGDGARGAIIVWEDIRTGSDPAIFAARLLPDGTLPWVHDGVEITPSRAGQRLAGVISDGAGGAYIGWWNRAGNDGDIFIQRIDGAGASKWTAGGIVVCAAAGRQEWAEMTADGKGGVLIAWHDRRGGNDNDIYAQRFSSDGTALWGADGMAVSAAAGDQSYPQLAADQDGGAFITWMDRRSEDDVYAQHVLADGTLGWKEDLPICTEPNRQIAPKVIPYGDHAAAFFWQDYRLGPTTSSLYLQIINTQGERYYPEDYQVSQSENAQSGMTLTGDGQGGALAVWTDYRSGAGEGDVYMRRIRADGAIVGDFGNALCNSPNTQERAAMISDGHGGGFAVWQDKRNTFDYDLYMNRISAQGQTNYTDWNAHAGVLLHRHDNNQLAPQVIESGAGYAIICWYDGRVLDGQADIYAQRVAWAPSLDFPASIDFGTMKVGRTVYDTIRVSNDGARPLTITNVRRASNPGTTHPQDFIFHPTFTLPATLQAGEFVDIALSFTPSGTGDRISELRISSDAPQDPVIIPLHGLGSNPTLQLKGVHQFRVTKVGTTNEEEITGMIRNTGTGMLVIPSITITGTNAERFGLGDNPPFPLMVEEGGMMALKLRFSPEAAGPREATLRVFSNADDQPKEARISGIGAEPTLVTIPLSAHFDSTMTSRKRDLEINIRNTSSVELIVSALDLIGPDAGEFAVESDLPLRIPGDGLGPVTLRFLPTTVGTKRAELLIVSDAFSSPDLMRITGTATLLGAVAPLAARAFSVDALYPQPLGPAQPMQLHLTVRDVATPVHVTLFDMLGRQLGELFSGRLDSPSATITLPITALDLAPGSYVLRVESGNQRVERILVRSN